MSHLDRLIRDARAAMKARGHLSLAAERWHESSTQRSGATLHCGKCHLEARVICKPQPNEIQIGGEAIALSCHVATKSALQRGTEIHERIERSLLTNPDNRERFDEIRLDAVMGC